MSRHKTLAASALILYRFIVANTVKFADFDVVSTSNSVAFVGCITFFYSHLHSVPAPHSFIRVLAQLSRPFLLVACIYAHTRIETHSIFRFVREGEYVVRAAVRTWLDSCKGKRSNIATGAYRCENLQVICCLCSDNSSRIKPNTSLYCAGINCVIRDQLYMSVWLFGCRKDCRCAASVHRRFFLW